MNYYDARQVDPAAERPDAGKWRYTCMNDGKVWPVGLCAEGCEGHDTADEAREHFRRWEVETARYDGRYSDVRRQCEAKVTREAGRYGSDLPAEVARCTNWTDGFAMYGPGMMACVSLCESHRSAEFLDPLIESVGTITSSY